LPCGLSHHRAIDGEPVARFNRKISDLLAHPEFMLL
jgi:pyruvate/2-oxoglutarate dehydrogenase complex dihydrolipoamide acyltransferase (E2) component